MKLALRFGREDRFRSDGRHFRWQRRHFAIELFLPQFPNDLHDRQHFFFGQWFAQIDDGRILADRVVQIIVMSRFRSIAET